MVQSCENWKACGWNSKLYKAMADEKEKHNYNFGVPHPWENGCGWFFSREILFPFKVQNISSFFLVQIYSFWRWKRQAIKGRSRVFGETSNHDQLTSIITQKHKLF